jgi:hypothetical protein
MRVQPKLRWTSLFLLGIGGAIPGRAWAGQSARLVYSRTQDASGCPDEPGLRQAVARRLGYDPFVAASPNTVVAELRGEGESLKARVYVIREGNRAGGARELAAPTHDCTELSAAMALAISIAVDPDALDRVEATPGATAGSTTPAETGEKPAPDASARAAEPAPPQAASAAKNKEKGNRAATPPPADSAPRAPKPRLTFGTDAAITLATGTAPSPVAGFALGISARYGNWAASLEPQVGLPSSKTASDGNSVRIWSYGGDLCAGPWVGPLYLGGLFETVVLNARGVISSPQQRHLLLPSAGLRAAVAIELARHVTLMPRVDGLVAFETFELQLDNAKVHTTPSAYARVGLAMNCLLD